MERWNKAYNPVDKIERGNKERLIGKKFEMIAILG